MVWYVFIPLVPYLLWLSWAAWKYPVPLSYNWRSLWQRKMSTLSTAAAIAVVVGIFVVVLSLAQGISRAFIHSGRSDQALVLRPNAKTELGSSIDRDQSRILKAHPLVVQDAEGPQISAECYVVNILGKSDGSGGSNVGIRGLEPAGIRMRNQVKLVAGRWFRSGLPELVVPHRMLTRFEGLGMGRSISFAGMDWKIVGIFEANGTAFESEIWTDVVDLMLAFKRDSYSSMLVRLASPAQVDGFARMVDEDKRLKLDVIRETDYFAQQTEAGKPIRILGNLITLILTIGAVFAAMNTMYASVSGRTSEIGTLRAIGFRQREILASFQWEAIMLCGTGGVIGSMAALWFNGIQTSTTNFETFSDVSFAFTITPALMLQGVAFSILMGMLGGFLPAWKASRLPVTEAMKG